MREGLLEESARGVRGGRGNQTRPKKRPDWTTTKISRTDEIEFLYLPSPKLFPRQINPYSTVWGVKVANKMTIFAGEDCLPLSGTCLLDTRNAFS